MQLKLRQNSVHTVSSISEFYQFHGLSVLMVPLNVSLEAIYAAETLETWTNSPRHEGDIVADTLIPLFPFGKTTNQGESTNKNKQKG